ncbi:MAG TPA: 2Fe-2S iron-sulfur cluster-binding protein [Polyangiaceae bacterium]|nr:2Fe-2S iron-sulfur cluster-binding protein [Polyangiaceae bacterium]
MAELTCGDRRLPLAAGETLLDALGRAGVRVPSSCRAGACQSCLVQVTRGVVPERAQVGLKDSLRSKNFVLACQAIPTSDLEVSLEAVEDLEVAARIQTVARLSEDVLRVELRVASPLNHRAGQFVTLIREDGLARPYSIASRSACTEADVTQCRSLRSDSDSTESHLTQAEGELLELHVRVLPSGRMSHWLASEQARGASVRVRGPSGDCFYVAGKPEQPLVLAGTGTGLAPLLGIIRDAIAAGHQGSIDLWHGARNVAGLYLRNELEALAQVHPNLSYHPCVLEGEPGSYRVGKLDELLLSSLKAFDTPRFFLCGDPPLVQKLKRSLFLRGASLKEIYADAFVSAPDAAA